MSHVHEIEPTLCTGLETHAVRFERALPASGTYKFTLGTRPGTMDAAIASTVVDDDEYALATYAGPARAILDLGGHIGSFSALTSRLYPNARITVLEPAAFNTPVLGHNLVTLPNVTALYNAVGARDGQIITVLNKYGENTGRNRATVDPNPAVHAVTKVLTLPTIARHASVDYFDVVKIDVEGAEYAVFDHPASAALLGQAAYIVGELHDKRQIQRGVDWLRKRFKYVHVMPCDPEAVIFHAWQDADTGPRTVKPNVA